MKQDNLNRELNDSLIKSDFTTMKNISNFAKNDQNSVIYNLNKKNT